MEGFVRSPLDNATKYLPSIFIICQVIVLTILIAQVFISQHYRAIKCRLNKATGVLYDRTLNRRNVSLRDETINFLLDEIADSAKLYAVGQRVGESFYEDYEKDFLQKHENYQIETKVKKWLEYDSSSGMGIFDLKSLAVSPLQMQVEIISPFVGDCRGNSHNARCNFLRGILMGSAEKYLHLV